MCLLSCVAGAQRESGCNVYELKGVQRRLFKGSLKTAKRELEDKQSTAQRCVHIVTTHINRKHFFLLGFVLCLCDVLKTLIL